jgi:hypothetical protein
LRYSLPYPKYLTFFVLRKAQGQAHWVFLSNKNTHRILKLANNKVSLVAGNNDLSAYLQVLAGCVDGGYKDGKATSALFNHIIALAYDSNNNLLILERGCAGYGEVKIRKLDTNGMISTIYNTGK